MVNVSLLAKKIKDLITLGFLIASLTYANLALANNDNKEPELASFKISDPVVSVSQNASITTAHPLATQAGLDILKRGGSAVDAAIAASLVLGVV